MHSFSHRGTCPQPMIARTVSYITPLDTCPQHPSSFDHPPRPAGPRVSFALDKHKLEVRGGQWRNLDTSPCLLSLLSPSPGVTPRHPRPVDSSSEASRLLPGPAFRSSD
ncbi:hypothetical protein IAR50_002100 [Cryptococcus sp. DSM 104548]